MNIEFKAHCRDHDRLRDLARNAGAEYTATLQQRDTYFRVKEGRLKLREIESSGAELIRYQRDNAAGPRESNYTVTKVRLPFIRLWWLKLRHGILVAVVKRRDLWLWRGVRIHIDSVEGLGDFMELEAVVSDIGDAEEAHRRCNELKSLLEIRDEDLVSISYSDMMLNS